MDQLVFVLGLLVLTLAVDCTISPPFNMPGEPLVPPAKSTAKVSTYHVTQQLDHFDDNSTDTWEMKYFVNDEHYTEGGPIFIFVGGEWAISKGWLRGGFMWDMAKELDGYMLYSEHRFYGTSHPTEDTSTENLEYLTVDQGIEDLVYIIRNLKANIPGASDSKVILVGGSYAGTLASWLKQRYPDVVTAVWASSAPVHAQLDFKEYREIIGKSFRQIGGRKCHNRIKKAFQKLNQLIASDDFEPINEEFVTCTQLDGGNQLNLQMFLSTITFTISQVAQHHKKNEIHVACGEILNTTHRDHFLGFANWISKSYDSFCMDVEYQNLVKYFTETSWEAPANKDGLRQWLYQTCNEFGYYQTSNSKKQIFGSYLPLDYNFQMCADIFDSEKFTPENIASKIEEVNRKNGGRSPNFSNVYTTHGMLDPWRYVGLRRKVNDESPFKLIGAAAHVADLYSIEDDDSDDMKATKTNLFEWVKNVVNAGKVNVTTSDSGDDVSEEEAGEV